MMLLTRIRGPALERLLWQLPPLDLLVSVRELLFLAERQQIVRWQCDTQSAHQQHGLVLQAGATYSELSELHRDSA